jgi:hypothetical protein
MTANTASPRKSRIGFVPLLVTPEQATFLQSLLERLPGSKGVAKVPWARKSRALGLEPGLELDRNSVGVSLNALILPNGAELHYAPGHQVTGFNPSKDRLFLSRQGDTWSAGLLYKPRTKKKKKEEQSKDGPKQKLYDETGLFVTESTGHRVWSGGLPSLGKRR